MKYCVTIGEEKYDVSVALIENDKSKIPPAENGADISFETAKCEYEHCIQRSVKLDNKVYILLTVCAFLFVMLSEAIKKIAVIGTLESKISLIFAGIYIAILTLNIVAFVLMLVLLIYSLKSMELKRFNAYDIQGKNLVEEDKDHVTKYICARYTQCCDYNNKLIEKRYKTVNVCIGFMVANVILLLMAAVFSNFF